MEKVHEINSGDDQHREELLRSSDSKEKNRRHTSNSHDSFVLVQGQHCQTELPPSDACLKNLEEKIQKNDELITQKYENLSIAGNLYAQVNVLEKNYNKEKELLRKKEEKLSKNQEELKSQLERLNLEINRKTAKNEYLNGKRKRLSKNAEICKEILNDELNNFNTKKFQKLVQCLKEANQEIGDNQIGHTEGSPNLNQRDYSQTLPRLADLVQDLSKIGDLLKRYEPKEGITAREQLLDRMQKEFWRKIDSFQASLGLEPSDGYHLKLNVELSHPKQENGELTDIEQFLIEASNKIDSIKKDNSNILKIANNDAEIFVNIMKEVNDWKKDNKQKLFHIYATIDIIPCFKDIYSRIEQKFKEADRDIEKCFDSAIVILKNNLPKRDLNDFSVKVNKIVQEFYKDMKNAKMSECPIYDIIKNSPYDIIEDQAYEEEWNKKIEEGRKKTPFNEMIKVRIEKLKPNYETLYSLITLCDDKVSELHDQRQKKTKECADIALSLLAGQIEKLDSEIQESDRQVSTTKKELGKTTQLLHSTNENIRGCKKRLNELGKEQEELKIERQRVDDKYKKLPPEAQKLFDSNFELKEKIKRLQKERSAIKEEIKKTEQSQHQTEGESSYVDKMVQGALDAVRQRQS
jgi:hypothetical protein